MNSLTIHLGTVIIMSFVYHQQNDGTIISLYKGLDKKALWHYDGDATWLVRSAVSTAVRQAYTEITADITISARVTTIAGMLPTNSPSTQQQNNI